MELNSQSMSYQAGDVVYVIYRNPHTQSVANVQEAAVVHDPGNPHELALFFYETYYPLTDEIAVYPTETEAEEAYSQSFGDL
ncbi:transcriptional regulator SplA domain-containing protein [Bacillus sp. KH172YL63]|uniref:transcriptional regulator SplA domain-containing protein n=1 Tax=Bacillus sp. KH172YL63 TaxID=2709784 RepID=UPI0013E42AD2|nr:transcriptional regulator SplA domain-containing protein [Bacillus sp. KH172YL63]BCB02872.1 transcriptional regulator SplA [Bacillus sp. KH172YL63]